MRNLTKTLALVSLLASTRGYTLGIGEIQLHSALNQNLNAEISLTLSGESVSDIKVNLASPEKFNEAGVSWNYFLSKIKFQTITHSNGLAIIKLTSSEALKEPFLDFLLEVTWPKGNLYREFTVLVDPPSAYNPSTTAAASSGTENYVQAPSALPQYQPHPYVSNEREYGPTLANDTLWSVAERSLNGQRGISVEQMMIAIYEANPQAFYKGNVHGLIAGKVLKIPEPRVALKLSRNQALAEFTKQTKAWRNHSTPDQIEAAKEKPVPSKAEAPIDNQLTLLAPNKAAIDDHAAVSSVNEQTGSGQRIAEDSSAATSEIVKGKPVPGVANEGTSQAKSVDSSIQDRVAALEKQLAMMQELIALKDQQLAALQNQSQAKPVAQQQAAPSEVVPSEPADQAKPAAQPVVAQPAPSEVEAVKPATHKPPAPKAATSPVAKPESGSLIDPYYMTVAGVGTAVLTVLGWLLWRKRKIDQETNTESMFASSSMIEAAAADENILVPVVDEGTVHDTGAVGESSFLSEFTPSDFDSFDTDQGEIDPISEADVYLAYGRYQQAEELIRQAIKDQPNRDECKLKLLEIFYANENKAAFEAYANELAEAGKRSEAGFWEQAAEMGREICPDSPLFSSGELARGSFVKETTESKDNNILDFDLAASKPEDDSFNDEQRNNQDIDFDLSSFSMDSKESDEANENVIAANVSLTKSPFSQAADFDSYSIGLDEPDQGVIAPNTLKSVESPVENLGFELSPLSTESDEADHGVIASNKVLGRSAAQIDDVDIDSSTFSIESDDVDHGVIASNTVSGRASAQIDDVDFDLSSFSMESDETDHGVIASNKVLGRSAAQIDDADFDLSSFSMESEEADQEAIASNTVSGRSATQIEDIDFELSSFLAEPSKENKDFSISDTLPDISLEAEEVDKRQELEAYEFDFNFDDADKTEEIEDIEFSALASADKQQQDTEVSEDELLDLDDDFDFNFDLDMLPAKNGQNAGQYDEFGVSDLTDMDELETKLDLAKAYVDMGDADAAKDIAKEVLEQGTVEQKKIAKALLDELN